MSRSLVLPPAPRLQRSVAPLLPPLNTSARLPTRRPCLHPLAPTHPGLRSLDGQYVVSVRRNDQLVHAVGPEFMLAAADILYLSGAACCCVFHICWTAAGPADTETARSCARAGGGLDGWGTPPGCCARLPVPPHPTPLRPPACPSGPTAAGIPDSTGKLAALGLTPYSDALEEVDDSQVPGLSSAFGVSSIVGETHDGSTLPGCRAGGVCMQAAPALPRAGGSGYDTPASLPFPVPTLPVPSTSPRLKGQQPAAGASAAPLSPPELVEAVIRQGEEASEGDWRRLHLPA